MIINTGQRTDIPAFYSEWFCNRLREGIVCVRNPFDEKQVSRYRLSPDVVDVIGFCTKNPVPMFPHADCSGCMTIASYEEGDLLHDVEQKSWIDNQLTLF